MRHLFIVFISLLTLACQSSTVVQLDSTDKLSEANTGEEVVKVNDSIIKEGYLTALGKMNPRIEAQLNNPATKDKLVDNLVDQELLFQESIKQGVQNDPAVLEKISLYKKVIVAEGLLEKELDKQALDYYNKNKDAEFVKVKIAHIQINFKDRKSIQDKEKKKLPATAEDKAEALKKAKKIISQLKAGESFSSLAQELSDDKPSQKRGGSLGEVSKHDKRMERRGLMPLVTAAFKMKKGEFSQQPIESKKAYHIILVEDEPKALPFEEVKQTIRFQIHKEVRENLLKRLRSEATIVKKNVPQKPEPAQPKKDPEDSHEGHSHP